MNFARQRGIAAAVNGERLTSADVESCPRLPETVVAKENIELLNYAVISGPSGCGKSITAYQVANDFRKDGVEILRLDHPVESPEALLLAMKSAPHPRLALIDDAQLVGEKLLRQIVELAADDLQVLIAATDETPGLPHHIRISNKSAVETLASEFLARRDEVLPIVSQIDNRVGDRYMDIPLERRIKSASKEQFPWQFSFILRGGWRTALSELRVLEDFDRADLALLAIAACQVVQLDKAVDTDWLYQSAALIGREEEWVDQSITILRHRQVLLPSEGIRCKHISFAQVVVECWFDSHVDAEFDNAVSLIRSVLREENAPLQGVAWLLNELQASSNLRFRENGNVVGTEERETILSRCLASSERPARGSALRALGQLSRWGRHICERIADHASVLAGWLQEVDDDYAGAFASLLLWLWNFDRDRDDKSPSITAILEGSSPERVAARIGCASQSSGYGWGELLSQVFSNSEPPWRDRFWSSVDKEHLLEFVAGFSSTQLADLSNFIQGFAPFDEKLALNALDRSLDAIEDALNAAPLKAWQAIDIDITWYILGYSLFRRRQPNSKQRKCARRIAALFPPARIAEELSSSRQRDWEPYSRMLSWVHEVDPQIHQKLVTGVDFSGLTEMSRGLWKRPPRELRLLLASLATDNDGEPSRSWVAQHKEQIEIVDPLTAIVAPDVAVHVLKRGGRVDLQGHNRDWRTQARALHRIAAMDKDRAREVALKNETHLLKAVSKLEQRHCDDDDITMYLVMLQHLDDKLLKGVLQKVDPAQAAQSWRECLRDRRVASQRAVALLVSAALECDAPIAEVARSLQKRIPQRIWRQLASEME